MKDQKNTDETFKALLKKHAKAAKNLLLQKKNLDSICEALSVLEILAQKLKSKQSSTDLENTLSVINQLTDIKNVYEQNLQKTNTVIKKLSDFDDTLKNISKDIEYLNDRIGHLKEETQELKNSTTTSLKQERYLSEVEHTLTKNKKKLEAESEPLNKLDQELSDITNELSLIGNILNENSIHLAKIKTYLDPYIPEMRAYAAEVFVSLEKTKLDLIQATIQHLIETQKPLVKSAHQIQKSSLKAYETSKNIPQKAKLDSSIQKTDPLPAKQNAVIHPAIGSKIHKFIFPETRPSFFFNR